MTSSLFILTGPPAAGKTTLARVALETIERVTGCPVLYLSSELILRIQTEAVRACQPNPPIRFQGSQLIIEDDFRSVVTEAAVWGVSTLATNLLRASAKTRLLVEIPEAGLSVLFKTLRNDQANPDVDLLLIWLDAPFDCRLERNIARDLELRLPLEAMRYFEESRMTLVKETYASLGQRTLFLSTAPELRLVSKLLAAELEAAIFELPT